MVFQTTAAHFEEVIAESNTRPVLVDFYAPWCAPCRELALQLEALSDRYEEYMSAYSVNSDVDAELAETYDVDALPTVLLLYCGRVLERWEKSIPMEDVEQHLLQHIPKFI